MRAALASAAAPAVSVGPADDEVQAEPDKPADAPDDAATFTEDQPEAQAEKPEDVIAASQAETVAISKDELREVVETALKQAALWDEVKDDLKQSGISLSGGQQQRLCIARAIANRPEVILMDEPASSLDPRSTAQIESLIKTLAENFSIAIVTHNMQEARRIADRVVFMHLGEIVEVGSSRDVFENPQDKRTQRYLRGEFAEDDPESDEDET